MRMEPPNLSGAWDVGKDPATAVRIWALRGLQERGTPPVKSGKPVEGIVSLDACAMLCFCRRLTISLIPGGWSTWP